ncbi:hypothetical protein GCM10027275_25160 [Rhabdobacter roseus]|uniref:Uncharacterized protein n=1 Tax=Rhabdobacter roseus TaxID=1655419 RepID=A0A840TJS5_9BACT|nr:hypothetical protein [Rhabdobacter roseus]MBB5284456.1 hypothetical protein [Rhabdobacter roseus]
MTEQERLVELGERYLKAAIAVWEKDYQNHRKLGAWVHEQRVERIIAVAQVIATADLAAAQRESEVPQTVIDVEALTKGGEGQ